MNNGSDIPLRQDSSRKMSNNGRGFPLLRQSTISKLIKKGINGRTLPLMPFLYGSEEK
ncbi:MAG: hypothetical protein K0Q90_3752 [Paenibacillaceae bacterium]|jgi:hypothetical protein|nr:hypothetical protein [Paenibacillaceae bacterium]